MIYLYQAGPLKYVKIPKNLQGESRSYGFIEYHHECSVDYAIRLFHGTALFGQELQLKHRKKKVEGEPPTTSHHIQHSGSFTGVPHFVPSPLLQFGRLPFVPGYGVPPIQLNPALGMLLPPVLPSHIRFTDNGSPRSDELLIPPGENSRNINSFDISSRDFNNRKSNYENSRNRNSYDIPSEEFDNRRSNYENSRANCRNDYESTDRRLKHSHSSKNESYHDRRPYQRSEHRSSTSYNEDDFRKSRRHQENDHRSSRTEMHAEVSEASNRRYRGDDRRSSKPYHDDSRSQRGRLYDQDRNGDSRR